MYIRKLGIILTGVVGSLLFGVSVHAETYGSVNIETLNVRQSPTVQSPTINQYSKNKTIKITNQVDGDWYEIELDKENKAYINTQYVDVYKVKATINGNGVNVRTYPSINSKINRQFSKGQTISVHYQVGDWYYISLGYEPFFGFVHKSYVEDPFLYLVPTKDISEVKEVKFNEQQSLTLQGTQSSKATGIINYAKKFIGNPYRYGGNSLTNGTDCSGFTQQIMKHAGVSIQRSSAAQYANNGVKVSTNNLQPGDLLFYGYNGRVSHVAIYIGNKQVIHANDSRTGITIGNAFPTRGKPYIGAKRVI